MSRADQLKWFPDRDVITRLREPIDRCLSFIHYVKSLPRGAFDVTRQFHTLPLSEWMDIAPAKLNLNNTMVRQLGGHLLDNPGDLPGLLDAAKDTLRQAFWVGRQQTMDMDVERLGGLLNCKIQPVRENETPGRPGHDFDPPEIIERLQAGNTYDTQLWRWAQDHLF
jgi:hypothetical protein